MIAYAALSFFCGIRAAEIERMAQDPNAFVLEDDTIRISTPKGYTRGIMPRIIKVLPNAKAWLLYSDAPHVIYEGAMINSVRETMLRLMKKNGIPFSRNDGRHSFITYHVAAFQDPAKTEALAGTSGRMRAHHFTAKSNGVEQLAFSAATRKLPHLSSAKAKLASMSLTA